ncbi:hypothetical protein, variant [Verruconis gallopava]|uniref:C2H2-type domain-containing protein n=1 Tax=Verruconis gallopava TaxID=253628 RepID=A0A0D2AM71_9PEZI|nr:hypothetical protein, variant [Verruconis gallopava]KIW00244.1 hypothetical protein, variant [Verruconis gallopava]
MYQDQRGFYSQNLPDSFNPVYNINQWQAGMENCQSNTYLDPRVDMDNNSQGDWNSSYAHSNATSEYELSQYSTLKHGQAPYTQAFASSRRASARSAAPSQSYTDSGFYSSYSQDLEMESFPYSAHDTEFNVDLSSHIGQTYPDSPSASDVDNTGYSSEASTPARNHPLYNARPSEDGLYHCPFANEGCSHEPKQLKCEYDKYIDSHIKPFRCRHSKCADLQFSSTACLLRHEREAHEMHGHEESLCEYPPCNRSVPGNGFRRSYNCKDHMTRCHGWVDQNPQEGKKRRSATTSSSGSKANKAKASTKLPSKRQQIMQLKAEWAKRKENLEKLTKGLEFDGPLFAIALTQINSEMQTMRSIQLEVSKLTGRGHIE